MPPSNPHFYYPAGFDPSQPYLPPTPLSTVAPNIYDTSQQLQPSFHTYTEPPATPLTLHAPSYLPQEDYTGTAAPFDASINEQLARLIAAKEAEYGLAAMTDPAEAVTNRTYRITPIQNPEISSALAQIPTVSRIPLAPPLIVQMDCWTSIDTLDIPHDELPFLVCHVSLETPEGADAMMVQMPDGGMQQNLYGTLVTTPAVLVNEAGATGTYFCFPDVSVRTEGTYRLRCTLFRITGGAALDTAFSHPFEVVNNAVYRAPAMTQHFHNQAIVSFGLPKDEW